MIYLFRPTEFFSERTVVPFLSGFIGVFFSGGVTFLMVLLTIVWIAEADLSGAEELIAAFGIDTFALTFLSSYITWVIATTLFYFVTIVFGERYIDYFSMLSAVGIGFIPIAIGSTVEFLLTLWLFVSGVEAGVVATHVILSGAAGLLMWVITALVYLVTIIWCGYIWHSAITKMGGVPLRLSKIVVAGVLVTVFGELLVLAVFN